MNKKEICRCVSVELIKTQVENMYKNIKCYNGIHKETWSRYPCISLEKNICRNDHCSGEISLSIRTPPRDIKIITIFSIKAEEKGYAYLNRHLRSLIENGIINNVTDVIKELNIPIISSTTSFFENPPLPGSSQRKK